MNCRLSPIALALGLIGISSSAGAARSLEPPKIDLSMDLEQLSLVELRLLRNTIYARHGYSFKDEAIQAHFWNLPWYQRIRRRMERAKRGFDPTAITRAERRFVARVRARERQLVRRSKRSRRPGQLYDYRLLANVNQFPKLEAQARRMIEERGFVVLPASHDQFFHVYEDNDYRVIPSFITSDSILQLYHVFFDYSLRQVEEKRLLPRASSLSRQLLERAHQHYRRATTPAIREASALALSYFAVASALFSGKLPQLPKKLRKPVRAELALIRAHRRITASPLMRYEQKKLDYTQFIPRGHYTRSKALKRFFRGMIWFGRAYFLLDDPRHLRAAVIFSAALERQSNRDKRFRPGPLRQLWQAIYEPTSFFVGKADDLTPEHVWQVWSTVAEVQGTGDLRLNEPKHLAQAKARLQSLDPRRIKTAHVHQPNTGIRFMGQRYIPDSEIFQRLIHIPERPFPKGLDLFAVLGNAEARELLDKHYREPERWRGYLAARANLVQQFRALPEASWSQNLYWSWIDTLRVLLGPPEAGAPAFAKTRAWRFKQLHTSLASWAELRHDTILYAKPFGAECGGDEAEIPKTRGYIEPVPRFYLRLYKLLEQTRKGLAQRQLLTTAHAGLSKQLGDLLQFLARVSRKQLDQKPISRREYEQMRLYGAELSYLTANLLSGGKTSDWQEVHGPDRSVAVVADIGTSGGEALEEAVGKVNEIFVVVEVDGAPMLTRGAVFSYYEFGWPVANRLSDERWQKLLEQKKAPPPPDWVDRFSTKQQCPKMPDVRFYSSGC
jgi:hypothetical protein